MSGKPTPAEVAEARANPRAGDKWRKDGGTCEIVRSSYGFGGLELGRPRLRYAVDSSVERRLEAAVSALDRHR